MSTERTSLRSAAARTSVLSVASVRTVAETVPPVPCYSHAVFTMLVLLMAQAPSPALQQIAWMSGCWSLQRGDTSVREQWMPPEGGTMLGMSRTIRNDTTAGYEFTLIRETAHELDFVARPSGQPEATFKSTRVSSDEVVFENLQHDYPTRIVYRRAGPGRLVAEIDGTIRGARRTAEFAYESCRND